MENLNSKQKGSSSSSSSSSSIATDLFGPKTSPSTSVFGSVFGPPPSGRAMGASNQGWNQAAGNGKYGGPSNANGTKNNNAYYQQQTTQPCHYSNSIYYGAQDDYPSNPTRNPEPLHQYKKDGQDGDDSEGGQGHGASRGNWWQGSIILEY